MKLYMCVCVFASELGCHVVFLYNIHTYIHMSVGAYHIDSCMWVLSTYTVMAFMLYMFTIPLLFADLIPTPLIGKPSTSIGTWKSLRNTQNPGIK